MPDFVTSEEPYYTFADENGNFLLNNVSQGIHDVVDITVVTVGNPKLLKECSIITLQDAKTGDKKIDKEIDRIIEHIQKSLEDKKNGSLWIDDWHLVGEPEGKRVFHEEHTAVKHMQKEINKTGTPEDLKVVYEGVINDLVEADKLLAKTAIEDAKNTPVLDSMLGPEPYKWEFLFYLKPTLAVGQLVFGFALVGAIAGFFLRYRLEEKDSSIICGWNAWVWNWIINRTYNWESG